MNSFNNVKKISFIDNWSPRFILEAGQVVKKNSAEKSLGKKADGLLSLPQKWTLPFFVISSDFFKAYISGADLKGWFTAIERAVLEVGINQSPKLIVRSSGDNEGIEQRGKYVSKSGSSTVAKKIILECLKELKNDPTISADSISIVVQTFLEPLGKGHLSNERRCYKEPRDWLGEYEQLEGAKGASFKINIRNWRSNPNLNAALDNALNCSLRIDIKSILQWPARWAMTNTNRLHFEWIWNGKRLWLVQADVEVEIKGFDPKSIVAAAKVDTTPTSFKILKSLEENLAKDFSKAANVLLYKKLGFAVAPIFQLDHQTIISDLSKNTMAYPLKEDIEQLLNLNSPLIIRTDTNETDHGAKQLLPRTESCTDYDTVEKWLFDTCKVLLSTKETGVKFAFFFHSFIPATSSAFAFAKPRERTVELETLWGLPEGLYYNSHDKWTVDTLSLDPNKISKSTIANFSVRFKPNHKPFCVAPSDSGKWHTFQLGSPYDWNQSVEQKDWIRQISYRTRLIAEAEGKPVSVMWFLGVPDNLYDERYMPWFHEQIDTRLLGQTITSRKKTYFDETFTISTEADLKIIEEKSTKSKDSRLTRIKISPQEDKLLRDKNLLKKIGLTAKKINATIVLEGGILSHPYYQLKATGAVVEVVHPFSGMEEKQEFNKLVRDKIPEKIQCFGEEVEANQIEKYGILDALRDKLVEEAYEVHDAEDRNSIIEEMADVLEILNALRDSLEVSSEELEQVRASKEASKGGFVDGLILRKTSSPLPSETAPKDNELFVFDKSDFGVPYTTLNSSQYQSIVETVERRTDKISVNSDSGVRLTMHIPVTLKSWIGETRSLDIPDAKFTAKGILAGKRDGDKVFVELNVIITPTDDELFERNLTKK